MNQEQLKEFIRLSAYINELIVEKFGRSTISNKFNRTQYGFYIRRRCAECWKSFCSVKIDIHKKLVYISFIPKCLHQISNEKNFTSCSSTIPIKNEENFDQIPNETFISGSKTYFKSCLSRDRRNETLKENKSNN